MPHALLQLFAGIASDLAALAGDIYALVEALRITRLAYLSDRSFG